MRHVGRGTLRTGTKLRQFERTVISAAHTLAALGRFAFWDTHKNLD